MFFTESQPDQKIWYVRQSVRSDYYASLYALMLFTIQMAFSLCSEINQAKTSPEGFFILLMYIFVRLFKIRNAFSTIFISCGSEHTAGYVSDSLKNV